MTPEQYDAEIARLEECIDATDKDLTFEWGRIKQKEQEGKKTQSLRANADHIEQLREDLDGRLEKMRLKQNKYAVRFLSGSEEF